MWRDLSLGKEKHTRSMLGTEWCLWEGAKLTALFLLKSKKAQ